MEKIAELESREILQVIQPSIGAFVPLLEANRAKIEEIPRKSFQYGPTDRHQLDVYYPIDSAAKKSQILVWVYGGGFVTGSRRMDPPADLGYASVGSYFAHRGFIVIIPDYRLAPNTIFPGAAEDVRDSILWAIKHPENLSTPSTPNPDTQNIILMGHSAGAVHAFASLLLPETSESAVLLSSISGAVLHAGIHHVEYFEPSNPLSSLIEQFYGGLEAAKEKCSLGLLRHASKEKITKLPRLLLVVAEKEPNWLLKIDDDFAKALDDITERKPSRLIAKGHNHISPNWAVSSSEGEEWADDVIAWIRG